MGHETHLSPRTDGRDHVQGEAAARSTHDRGFPARRPGRSGVIVGAHAGFIAEIDRRSGLPGESLDGGIVFLLPARHPGCILLPGPVGGPLDAEAQGLHHIPDGHQGHLLREAAGDQVPHHGQCPQGERKFVLFRMVAQGLCQPGQLLGVQLGRAPGNGLGLQGFLPAGEKHGHPTEDRSFVETKNFRDLPHRLALAHRTDTHLLQSSMVQLPGVVFTHVISCQNSSRRCFTFLYGCLHVCKMTFDAWHSEVELQPYIRSFTQVMPADPDGIRRKSPHL